MRRSRIALVLVAVMAGAAAGACEPNFERMTDQRRAGPYEASTFFPDGRVMQRPPAGTVHRDAVVGPEELMQGTRDGQYVERIPREVTPAVLERGKNRFGIFCAPCHGMDGAGVSKVAQNMHLRPPPSLHEPRLRAYPAGRMYRVVNEGYGLMRSYAVELPLDDRWAVVAYVQALQLSRHAPLDELPAELRQEAARWLR